MIRHFAPLATLAAVLSIGACHGKATTGDASEAAPTESATPPAQATTGAGGAATGAVDPNPTGAGATTDATPGDPGGAMGATDPTTPPVQPPR